MPKMFTLVEWDEIKVFSFRAEELLSLSSVNRNGWVLISTANMGYANQGLINPIKIRCSLLLRRFKFSSLIPP